MHRRPDAGMSRPRAIIVGIAGPALLPQEARLLAALQPLGVILFGRNVAHPAQVHELTSAIRSALGRADAPILVDQEGGRVQRLGPPHWPAFPPARQVGALAEGDRSAGVAAACLLAGTIGRDLVQVGIDWVCAPVLDLLLPQTHAAIGDRAFAADPDLVAALGRAMVDGFLASGVVPIVKHAPGHGRAGVDPHAALPTVTASAEVLADADFRPFAALSDAPAVMVAHVVYAALDPTRPASCSPAVVALIRERLGCAGLVISDDIDMGALAGSTSGRVRDVIAAGNDVALQCNGRPADLEAALHAAPILSAAAAERMTSARQRLGQALPAMDSGAIDRARACVAI